MVVEESIIAQYGEEGTSENFSKSLQDEGVAL